MRIIKQRAFKRFVEEIYEVYKRRSIKTRIGYINNPTTSQIGADGEYEVQMFLKSLGYVAQPSPQSRTPADIYGLKQYEDFIHITGIQVKSTITNLHAHPLSQTELYKMEKLPEFIAQIYLGSNQPLKFNTLDLPLVITADYIGVVNEEIDVLEHISGLQTGRLNSKSIDKALKKYYF